MTRAVGGYVGIPYGPGGMTMAAGPRHTMTTENDLRVFIQQYTLARAPSWEKGRERENAFETIQDAKTVFNMIERQIEIEIEAAIARDKQTEAEKAKARGAAVNAMRTAGIPASVIQSWMGQPDLDQKLAAEIIAAHVHRVVNPPVLGPATDDDLDRKIAQQLSNKGGLVNVAKKALGYTSRKV